jgi:hypothetical protein
LCKLVQREAYRVNDERDFPAANAIRLMIWTRSEKGIGLRRLRTAGDTDKKHGQDAEGDEFEKDAHARYAQQVVI